MFRRCAARLDFPPKDIAERFGGCIVTHNVLNQVPYFENYNTYALWPRVRECVTAYGAAAKYEKQFEEFGKTTGSAYFLEQAHLANKTEPVFTPFDRQGRRINAATLCESYHRLMKLGLQSGMAALPFTDPEQGHLASCVLFTLFSCLEQGTGCPITMTAASTPSLLTGGERYKEWVSKMTAADYDPRDIHISQKTAATCGMSMTEKQGGSDVRQNTSFAIPLSTDGGADADAYRIVGHKWFTSAPMSDSFLTLAYSGTGELSCFLIPRWLSPTERNTGLCFQRLKNKMGDKSNASSEVEYNNAIGYLVGKRGEGVKTIIKMVNHTRLLCGIGSSSLMAIATSNAIHHCQSRRAFGGALIDKPVMLNVLCDLIVEVEASLALSLRIAHSFDKQTELSEDYKRLAVAVAKYTICKRCTPVVYEAMECMGGNGYLEDFPLARFYRQAPLNAIWEGSGNVIVLDVLRTIHKSPRCLVDVFADIAKVPHPDVTKEAAALQKELGAMKPADYEVNGRRLVERLGLLLQAAALYHSNPTGDNGAGKVFEAFVASRIAQRHLGQLGTLDPALVDKALVERNLPVLDVA